MRILEAALMFGLVAFFAGLADWFWVDVARPWFVRRRGWPEQSTTQRIPRAYIVGSGIVVGLFFAVACIGAAAGY